MNGIKNMEGVLSCHTSYTINSNQRICNIKVTDHLANLLDNRGLILTGPVCPLTFKLRSGGDEDDSGDLEQHFDSDPSDVVVLDSVSDGGSIQSSAINDDMLDSSTDSITPTNSPAGSEASATVALSTQFKLMGSALPPPMDSST